MFLALGLLLIYSIALFWMSWQWINRPVFKSGGEGAPTCSVLVPFRNERENLPSLVSSLDKQVHRDFEVIFINDHSADLGEEKLKEFLTQTSLNWKLFSLQGHSGKKAALQLGVKSAANDIIVTIDADCTVEANWLRAMLAPFEKEQVQMVLGPVMLKGKSLWQQMQSVEFSTLIGVTGVTAKWRSPVMANGANLAYRKSAFEKVNGFKGIDTTPSGDDELLMHKIQREFGKSIVFNSAPEALVKTSAFANWWEFKNQRLRWASKWKVGFRPMTIFTALVVFLVQLAQLSIIGLAFAQSDILLMISGLLPLKLLSELLFISLVRAPYLFKTPIHIFLLCFILYPFYAVYFGIAANFKKFEWKGRKYTSATI